MFPAQDQAIETGQGRTRDSPMSGTAQLYNMLADLTLAVHVAFVLFVVGGQVLIVAGWILGWCWTRHRVFRTLHLGAIALVVLEGWFGLDCPLTVLENRLRNLAGTRFQAESFIGYWLQRLLFYTAPAWVFNLVYSVFALLVVVTFLRYPPQRRGSVQSPTQP
jgi:hypothetical protein